MIPVCGFQLQKKKPWFKQHKLLFPDIIGSPREGVFQGWFIQWFIDILKNPDSFSLADQPSSVWFYHQSCGKMMATVAQGVTSGVTMLKRRRETSSSLPKVRKFSCKNFLLDSSNPFGQTGEQAHFLTSSYTGDDTPFGAFGGWRWSVAPETHK